jgi:hypothetical protein
MTLRPTPLHLSIIAGAWLLGLTVLYIELRSKVNFATADHVAELECRVAAVETLATNLRALEADEGCEAQAAEWKAVVREARVTER